MFNLERGQYSATGERDIGSVAYAEQVNLYKLETLKKYLIGLRFSICTDTNIQHTQNVDQLTEYMQLGCSWFVWFGWQQGAHPIVSSTVTRPT